MGVNCLCQTIAGTLKLLLGVEIITEVSLLGFYSKIHSKFGSVSNCLKAYLIQPIIKCLYNTFSLFMTLSIVV